jgi:biotin carboxyl carrier protein
VKPDIVRTGNTWSILLGTRSYEVTVVEEAPGELAVSVDGQVVRVRRAGSAGLAGLGRRTRLAKRGAGATDGPQSITAPMPGRIVKVLVTPGDAVAARQGLVVVEAMKMENELRSPKAGTVTEVRVTQGQSVEARAVLVVVE